MLSPGVLAADEDEYQPDHEKENDVAGYEGIGGDDESPDCAGHGNEAEENSDEACQREFGGLVIWRSVWSQCAQHAATVFALDGLGLNVFRAVWAFLF
jgi:hypothetical protein